MTNLNAIRHSVVAVTLPESDYYTLFSAYKNDGERDPDAVEVEWYWYSLESSRTEFWTSLELLQECRFLDHAEELRLNLLHTLAIMPAEYLIIRRGK
jgi:hypothetical protein